MNPKFFLAEIAQPNVQKALEEPDDLRMIINAILSLDALAGIIHAHASAAGRTTIDAYKATFTETNSRTFHRAFRCSGMRPRVSSMASYR